MWNQIYNPLGNEWLSTLIAAVPVVVLLALIASGKVKAHLAAVIALVAAICIAIWAFTMPAGLAVRASVLGLVTGFFPIGWIVLNVIFLYRLAVEKGSFELLQRTIGGVSPDRRIQLLLIAFSFGAFFEGASGFGTPVAVTGAMLMGLGFSPLAAAGLSLIANTAPVAYGALGTPIQGLASVTGLDPFLLGAMVGRQLPFFSLIVPFWLIWAFAGWKGMKDIWPAILVTGVSFAVPQFLISNFINPWIVDIGASLVSMACLIGFLKVWQPKELWLSPALRTRDDSVGTMPASTASTAPVTRAEMWRGLLPWVIVCIVLLVWGSDWFKVPMNKIFVWSYPVEGLHNLIAKVPPVVAKPTPEGAVFSFTWLTYTGSGMLIAAIVSAFLMGFNPLRLVKAYGETIWAVRYSLLTIAAMLAIGTLTRYSGIDATLGLAFAHAGFLYPFFGTLLGWLGVALTGSDTASNVLFGGLQKITAEQLGLSPILMAAANSSGGVMGKMIDAQSIVVASTATNWFGHEGSILRFVFKHSIALACLVGVLVMLQAYVFTGMVIHP
ncbi:MAG: L-lactate permease [Reyranella sp.]|uniref:L-lactate permease n=1 Tax=Reyranella sp. TaxID=1929291 RepID=UPI001AC865BB|nr:L-lactate permease [Reyranella sp.]MBN9088356.1 L-lactate permease [Reyranella sp.]